MGGRRGRVCVCEEQWTRLGSSARVVVRNSIIFAKTNY